MKWQQLISDEYTNMFNEMEKVLDDLTIDDLHKRPNLGANPIGWLCWHTIRSCDRFLGDVVLGKQLWISAGWNKKFNRAPDYNDTGFGFTNQQVDSLFIPSAAVLVDYGRTVKEPLLKYIEELTEQELERQAPFSMTPGATRMVSERLVGTLMNLQHIGAAAYVRGIIKGQGWYGR
jgi:hypothetical protein